jgi:NTE family protein
VYRQYSAPALALMVGLAVAASAARAESGARACIDPATITGPRIGLVLGGGGARGAAHIGVIKRLEELRVPVHYVTGTSMGSLVGGFYATGMSASELEHTVSSIDFEALFQDSPKRKDLSFRRKRDDNLALYGPKLGVGRNSQLLPRGAIHGQNISYLFESLTSARTLERDFDRLPIPYRAVAADIETGQAVVMGEGGLSVAMRSSMSVPGVFDPVAWNGHLLVDGGIANNLPVNVARDLGAEVVIAVEVGTPPAQRANLNTMADFVGQLSNLMINNNARAQIATLGPDDILLEPELGNEITSAGFSEVDKAVVIGYAAALRASDELSRYSIPEAEYSRWRAAVESCVGRPRTIDYVNVENRSRFSDEVIAKRLDVVPGQTLEPGELEEKVKDVYALGFLDLVRHEVVEREDGATGVELTVDQDARGTDFIEWGLDVQGDGDESDMNLRIAYLKTDLDSWGSEFRALLQAGDTPGVMTELYKGLGPELRWFVRPRVYAQWDDVVVYDVRGQPTQVVNIDQWGGDLALQREFANHSAVWAGLGYYDGSVTADVGQVPAGVGTFKGGEYSIGYEYDTLDDRYYPSDGAYVRTQYVSSMDELNSDRAYDQFIGTGLAAATWGHYTLIGNANYGTTLSGHAPYWTRFRIGGLFALSGLQTDQISGDHYGVAMASWRYAVAREGAFFPAHVGISAEYGNAADDRDDIIEDGIAAGSLYFAYRSPIGPVYWGVGFAEGGQRAYFLSIGNIFGRTSLVR